MTTVSATTARDQLYNLIEEVSLGGKRIGITKNGETKAVLISPEELASWEATMEVMSDPKAVRNIKKSLKDVRAGRVVSWEEVKKKAGL